jgi:hypothetical protein
MKKTNLITIVLVTSLLFGCSGVKVTTDYEKKADYSQYKTFSFLGWQKNSDMIMNDVGKKLMRDAFMDEFQKRNLTLVESGGDLAISLFLVVNRANNDYRDNNYAGERGEKYRRNSYGYGGGTTKTSYSNNYYLKGTLVMDVYDESSGHMVWQAVAAGAVQENPEKREKSIPKTVVALMKKFPVPPAE